MSKQQRKLLISIQPQARKPIYLLEDGDLVCGRFRYNGRYKKPFSEKFTRIVSILNDYESEIIDVCGFKYWTAVEVYNEFIVSKWQCSISAQELEQLAKETLIISIINDIKDEFHRSINLKLRKAFNKLNDDEKQIFKEPWQLVI